MKKLLITILIFVFYFSSNAQSPLRINKYLIDSLGTLNGSQAWRLYHDSLHNGSWALIGSGGGSVDSVTLRNDSLFYWVGAANTLITPVVPYNFTSLADNNMLRYDAGTSSFVNTNIIQNIRWQARVGSTTSSATPTINTDNVDIYKLTAQAADISSFTTNLSGSPNDGDILEIQITGTATRNITWGASFVSSTVTLPTATVTTATLTVILQYYTTSSYGNNKWVCVNYY